MKIQFIKREEINDILWDECISNSLTPLIYGKTWYLDLVCDEWNGLVMDNYYAVMPLPLKKKYGLKYLTHPQFIQQLGIFVNKELSNEIIEKFFQLNPYFFTKIKVNKYTYPGTENTTATELPNYVLKLNSSYDHIKEKFSANTKRNIAKSAKYSLTLFSNTDLVEFKSFYERYSKINTDRIYIKHLNEFIEVCLKKGKGKIYSCKDTDHNILSTVFILKEDNRLYYHTAVTSEPGFSKRASFFFVSELIKEYADTNNILDFEGSQVDGIARFFKGFGAIYSPYFLIKNTININNVKKLIQKSIFRA